MKEEGILIAVEGVIGIGKTTITKHLAKRFGLETMFEIVEENPFLEKFYNDPKTYGFQVETFFLCNRYTQLQEVMKKVNAGKTLISDYHIAKNLIFASINLEKEERKKYKELFNIFINGFKHPDILIISRAELNEILRRIRKRARVIEKGIDPEYLDQLIHKYNDVMNKKNLQKRYPGIRIIEIDANTVDFLKTPERYKELEEAVEKAMKDSDLHYQLIA